MTGTKMEDNTTLLKRANRKAITNHLGYYVKESTQGQQLYEYVRDKDFKITIKVIEFDNLKPYLLNVIEKLLAKK